MMTNEKSLGVDAWIREAQEATKLVEDVESTIKNKEDLAQQNRLKDIAQSKLFEAGVKLDRLESLLHNPPSKPILTKEDLEFRWKMLSDICMRTRSLALSLCTSKSRIGRVPAPTTSDANSNRSIDRHDGVFKLKLNAAHALPEASAHHANLLQTHTAQTAKSKTLLSEDDPELLKPLIPENATPDQVQLQKCGCISTSLISQVCWTICLILGGAALVYILVILCAVI